MTRLLVLSDLHLEFGESYDPPPASDFDVCILAGDTAPGLRGLEWAVEKFPGRPVIYCLGNHEFYGHATPRLIGKLRAAAPSNVFIMDDSEVVLGDTRFVGATLWTDFALSGAPGASRDEARRLMNDYSRIRVTPNYRKLSPADTSAMHSASRRFIASRLAAPFPGKTVVVTHHAPHPAGLGERSGLDPAYASDLTPLFASGGVDLWIYGHTHVAASYEVAGVPVISNARGYPGDNPAFRPALVIDTASLVRRPFRPGLTPTRL